MNVDRRIVGAAHGPSDDSGSDGEENLRVSRSLKTYEQQLEPGGGLSLKWPSVCKVIPGRINHSKTNVEAGRHNSAAATICCKTNSALLAISSHGITPYFHSKSGIDLDTGEQKPNQNMTGGQIKELDIRG